MTASFIDAATGGGIIGQIQIATFSAATVTAQVTANDDQIVFTLGQTTYSPINIP